MGLRRDPTCTRCGRSYSRGKSCLRCKDVQRGHVKAATRGGIDPTPHPCSKCGRTVRGGICPGPNC